MQQTAFKQVLFNEKLNFYLCKIFFEKLKNSI